MTWNEGKPGLGNSVAADIADIAENFQHNTDTTGSVEDIADATAIVSVVLNTGVSGTAVLDEDDLVSDSATKLATQQSIKAYVDASAQMKNVGFRATMAGDQAIGTGASFTPIEFDTESWDNGSDFAVGTYRFTVPATGKYLVHINCCFDSAFTQNGTTMLRLVKDPDVGETPVMESWFGNFDSTDTINFQMNGVIALTAADVIEAQISHESAQAETMEADYTWWDMHQLY